MSLVVIHSRLSIAILLYVIILCIWSFWRYIRKSGVDGNFWGSLVTIEILILIQGALGGILYFGGLQPERGGMHILYGVFGALGLPAVYLFTKGRNDPRVIFVYSVMLFFIALRGMANAFVNTAWNGWLRDIVPQDIMGSFFAQRLRLATIASAVAAILAALYIDWWKESGPTAEIFGYSYAMLFGSIVFVTPDVYPIADEATIAEQGLDLFGRRIGCHVEILGM